MPLLTPHITVTRKIVSYDINEYSESPGDLCIRASVRVRFEDGGSEIRDLTLWHGPDTEQVPNPAWNDQSPPEVPQLLTQSRANSYASAGQWTDTTAATRIRALLSGS